MSRGKYIAKEEGEFLIQCRKDGMSYGEIAELTNRPYSSVKNWLTRNFEDNDKYRNAKVSQPKAHMQMEEWNDLFNIQETKQVSVQPVTIKDDKPLTAYSVKQLSEELRGRGVVVLINPEPRELIARLVDMGYMGTLEYYEKKTINLNTIKQ